MGYVSKRKFNETSSSLSPLHPAPPENIYILFLFPLTFLNLNLELAVCDSLIPDES